MVFFVSLFVFEQSEHGTYVNGRKVNEMELKNGDNISLVRKDFSEPDTSSRFMKRLQYELCRSEGNDKANVCDTVKVKRTIVGEILVQTTTEPIVIDDSDSDSDFEMEERSSLTHQSNLSTSQIEKKVDNYVEDYEVGEPSGIPQPPRQPRPPSPISLVSPVRAKNK